MRSYDYGLLAPSLGIIIIVYYYLFISMELHCAPQMSGSHYSQSQYYYGDAAAPEMLLEGGAPDDEMSRLAISNVYTADDQLREERNETWSDADDDDSYKVRLFRAICRGRA